jgi:hypothetical protein
MADGTDDDDDEMLDGRLLLFNEMEDNEGLKEPHDDDCPDETEDSKTLLKHKML